MWSSHHPLPGWVSLLSPLPCSPFPCGGTGPHMLQAPQCSTLCSSSTDCDSYCKPAKGNYKINMKKYCKKDYGKDFLPPWAMLGFATEAAEGWPQADRGWGRCRCPRGWGAPSMERRPQIRPPKGAMDEAGGAARDRQFLLPKLPSGTKAKHPPSLCLPLFSLSGPGEHPGNGDGGQLGQVHHQHPLCLQVP